MSQDLAPILTVCNFCGFFVIFACGEVLTPIHRIGILVAVYPNPMIS